MAKTASKSGPKKGAAKMPNFIRKFIVALKRRPHYIPLAVFLVAFIIYSFHLSDVSDTTALLQGSNMGLAGFATMLLSMLSLVCFLNAFPYRKPVNKPMLILMILMVGIVIFCDVFYIRSVGSIVRAPGANIEITAEKNTFIIYADWYLRQHIGYLIAGLVLTVLLPVYSKLIRKINTNVEVEGNGEMAEIDISAE